MVPGVLQGNIFRISGSSCHERCMRSILGQVVLCYETCLASSNFRLHVEGAHRSISATTPLLTMSPFSFVRRFSSLPAAHQLRLAPGPFSAASSSTRISSFSPPRAPTWLISKTAPFIMAVRTSVCLSGKEVGEGVKGGWVRHATEKVAAVVGVSDWV